MCPLFSSNVLQSCTGIQMHRCFDMPRKVCIDHRYVAQKSFIQHSGETNPYPDQIG